MGGLSHPLAWWLANTITPSLGQQCLVIDLGWQKVGDGVNTFNNLPFINLPPVNVWFSTWSNIPTKGTTVQDFEIKTLLGGTFVQEGGKCTFEFTATPASSANIKTIKIYFNTSLLITITIPTGTDASWNVKGFIKVIDLIGGKGFYSISVNGAAPTTGTLTGINWAANIIYQVTGSGTADADLTYNGGDGMILIMPRFSFD